MAGRTLSPTSSTSSYFPQRHLRSKSPLPQSPGISPSSSSSSILPSSSKRSNFSDQRISSYWRSDVYARSKRLGQYFWDGDINSGFDVDFSFPPDSSTASTPSTAASSSQWPRAEDLPSASAGGENGELCADDRKVELDHDNANQAEHPVGYLSPPIHFPHHKTFWEAELAAKQELEEDEDAWYTRNPHRYPWKLGKSNLSMRPKIQENYGAMNGTQEPPESFPTRVNRMLFAAYIGRHFQDLAECCRCNEVENKGESEEGQRESRQMSDVACGSGKGDWHEDLFSSSETRRLFSNRWSARRGGADKFPRASSIESYTSSTDSANTSEGGSAHASDAGCLETDMDSAPAHAVSVEPSRVNVGPEHGVGSERTDQLRLKTGPRSGVAGRRRFSFLRISACI